MTTPDPTERKAPTRDGLRYLHWGATLLPDGTILTPPASRGVPGANQTPDTVRAGYQADRVYLWDTGVLPHLDPNQPWGAHLYEVEPLGPVHPDPERIHGYGAFMDHAWVTTHARIIRRIENPLDLSD